MPISEHWVGWKKYKSCIFHYSGKILRYPENSAAPRFTNIPSAGNFIFPSGAMPEALSKTRSTAVRLVLGGELWRIKWFQKIPNIFNFSTIIASGAWRIAKLAPILGLSASPERLESIDVLIVPIG